MGNLVSRWVRKLSCIFLLCNKKDKDDSMTAAANEKTQLWPGDDATYGCDEETGLLLDVSQIADQHLLPVNELASQIDEKLLENKHPSDNKASANAKMKPRPKLKDMVHKVMAQRNGDIEDGRLPTVNKMMKIWEQAMQQRDKFIEEGNIDSVNSLRNLWENGGGADAAETNDSEDIVELSTLFDYSEYSNALHSSDLLEEQVVDELATRIEEKLMLILANQEGIEDLEKSCKIIHNILTRNPKSSITKKTEFKNIAKKVITEVRTQNKKEEENANNANNTSTIASKNNKFKAFVLDKVIAERHEVIQEDNIDYSSLMGMWEKGKVTGKGRGATSDDDDDDDDYSSSDDYDDPSLRRPTKGTSLERLPFCKRDSIRETKKKKGNVNNLISMWSTNANTKR